MLPLRGFIRCSECNRTLCGSTSKGRKGYYYYYHCSSACGCRYKAKEVNKLFEDQLMQFIICPDHAELFTMVITDSYNNQSTEKENRSELLKEINKLTERLSRARELLLNGDIDGSDYKTIKSENEHKLEVLEVKLADTIVAKKQKEDIVPIVMKAIEKLTRLDAMYLESSTSQKRELIG